MNKKRRQTRANLALYSISRFEQRDGGMYVELEAVTLSRDVPGALRWLVDPMIRRTSRSSMQISVPKAGGAVLETRLTVRSNANYDAPAKSAFSNNLPAARIQNGLMP